MGHKMDDATSDPYEKEVIVNDEWGRQLYNLPRFANIGTSVFRLVLMKCLLRCAVPVMSAMLQ